MQQTINRENPDDIPDDDQDIPAAMTASYSEISFHETGHFGGESSASFNPNMDKQTTKLGAQHSPQRPASLSYNRRKGEWLSGFVLK